MNKKSIIELSVSSIILFALGFKIGRHQAQKEEKKNDVQKKSFRKYILMERKEEE